MTNARHHPQNCPSAALESAMKAQVPAEHVPLPTAHFRRRAWLEFQRAIDPLAPPKPLRQHEH